MRQLESAPLRKASASRLTEGAGITVARYSGFNMKRCPWAKTELYEKYHDTEWGVPVHDDRLLFEFLVLEGRRPV